MTKNTNPIFKTHPHGEQDVWLHKLHQGGVNNSTYAVVDSEGKEIFFTGEELTSLANQWLAHAVASERCSASLIEARQWLASALPRLELVEQRLRDTLRGKEWTRREYDANVLLHEVIPAVERALAVMPN